jgi:hypothetical protein
MKPPQPSSPDDAVALPQPGSPGEETAAREAIAARLSYIFRRTGPDVTSQALLRAILEYRLEKLK